MIQNVHSLQAWRDFLQISVNAGLIAAEALFLKWSLCDMRGDKRKLIESWVDIAGLNLAGLWLQEYRLLLSPLLYTRYLCVFLIVNVYEDSPRKKNTIRMLFSKDTNRNKLLHIDKIHGFIAKQFRRMQFECYSPKWVTVLGLTAISPQKLPMRKF